METRAKEQHEPALAQSYWTALLVIGGAMAALAFIAFLNAIKATPIIWYANRLFGSLSYFFLFIAILLGELRMLAKVKGDFTLFRFHKPIAIFSLFLVLLHALSAILDKYKWGKSLNFTDYLGFNFSDKWMAFLSFGALALYLLVLVGATSANRGMRILGFKRWKGMHYFSYLAFVFAYIHAVNLGTDLKTGALEPILFPFFRLSFLIIVALFMARTLHGFAKFSDQWEINLSGAFFIILVLGSAFLAAAAVEKQNQADAISLKLSSEQQSAKIIENYNQGLLNQTILIRNQMRMLENG